jgi:hypothetical protein
MMLKNCSLLLTLCLVLVPRKVESLMIKLLLYKIDCLKNHLFTFNNLKKVNKIDIDFCGGINYGFSAIAIIVSVSSIFASKFS